VREDKGSPGPCAAAVPQVASLNDAAGPAESALPAEPRAHPEPPAVHADAAAAPPEAAEPPETPASDGPAPDQAPPAEPLDLLVRTGPHKPVPAAAVPAMRRIEARFGRHPSTRFLLARPPHNAYGRWGHIFAAIDLGTNNCRLLVAKPHQTGFKVLDNYSRTVCLGEGLTATGKLSAEAMARTILSLKICAKKIERAGVTDFRAVATEACRTAENGPAFIDRIEAETGLRFDVISAEEEARLAVESCASLIDRDCDNILVFDIGGGSTELVWLDMARRSLGGPIPIGAWTSLRLGVVSLTERFGTGDRQGDDAHAIFDAMVSEVRAGLAGFEVPEQVRASVRDGRTHIVGNSGTVTTIAGVLMGLPRYDRKLVDGAWIDLGAATRLARELSARPQTERAEHPCIGPDRAALLLPGAAILEAIQSIWPCTRLRVADRGLREGVLLSLMAQADHRARQRRALSHIASAKIARPLKESDDSSSSDC
jgi:exopolyphosphatase / guanosine-5'-triphosphate,3'-diphosphate pyrophosphatase